MIVVVVVSSQWYGGGGKKKIYTYMKVSSFWLMQLGWNRFSFFGAVSAYAYGE
jgi:hypothetical protein